MRDTFERVTCITMSKTPARWDRVMRDLPDDWPFKEIERVEAIDGKKVRPPDWWKQGAPAWGCYRSHLRIIEECLNAGIKSVLLLEDDFICCDDFKQQVEKFLEACPCDWEMMYLGGQHLMQTKHPPIRVNERVVRPYNVNRTHAFALRGNGLHRVYAHLTWTTDWRQGHHIDHHLGRLVQRRQMPCYAPTRFLIGQNDERSTINFKQPVVRFWAGEPEPETAFVAVVGLHRSGSSALANVLRKLGVHMGTKFVGCESDGGGEAQLLARRCESHWPFPQLQAKKTPRSFETAIRPWVTQKLEEARRYGTIAGGKYPHLCVYAPQLESILGRQLQVIHIDRPLEESVASLVRRSGRKISHDVLRKHQEVFYAHKQAFLATTKAPVLHVQYDDMLKDPRATVERILEFLPQLNPEASGIEDAVAYVDPSKRHIVSGNDIRGEAV